MYSNEQKQVLAQRLNFKKCSCHEIKKTSELLFIKYIKSTKFFVMQSHHHTNAEFKIAILYYSRDR